VSAGKLLFTRVASRGIRGGNEWIAGRKVGLFGNVVGDAWNRAAKGVGGFGFIDPATTSSTIPAGMRRCTLLEPVVSLRSTTG
jgi:hypothetical protein